MQKITTEAELQLLLKDKATEMVESLQGQFSGIVSDRFLAITLASFHRMMLYFKPCDLQTAAGEAGAVVFQSIMHSCVKTETNLMKLRNQYVLKFLDIEYVQAD
jgi:hypothetical protein